jgi:hypothetical protein
LSSPPGHFPKHTTSVHFSLHLACIQRFSGAYQGTVSFTSIGFFQILLQTMVTLPLAVSQFLSCFEWPISDLIFCEWFVHHAACFFFWFLAWLPLQPWRWRWFVSLRLQAFSELHDITIQKIVLFVHVFFMFSCFYKLPW